MSRFDDSLHFILDFEGDYSDDAHDRGGKTRFGITELVARAHGYGGDMRELPLDVARDIYRQSYWEACKCDLLPWPLSCLVFDAAVNQGVSAASRMMQRALGVTDDGVIGPATLKAANNAGAEIAALFLAERAIRYAKNEQFSTYGRGWLKRTYSLALGV